MERISKAPNATLFTAVTFTKEQGFPLSLEKILEKLMPGEWNILGPFPFSDITDYYEKEMGANLSKIYAVNLKSVSLENSAGFKLKSNLIEDDYRINGHRAFNIDPGFLTRFNFTLLTTKGYSHRIYLGHGIWSELTLYYQDKHFHPLPWTYPDYKNKTLLSFLEEERNKLVK